MASKLLILSIACVLSAGVIHALPVNNEQEAKEVSAATEKPLTSSVETPEEPIFNYEIPTEEELNPDDLDDEQKLLQELQPPGIDSYVPFAEPAEKPRKGSKKYNPDEKWINKKTAEAKDDSAEEDAEQQDALLQFIFENLFKDFADQYNAQRSQSNSNNKEEDTSVLVLNQGEYIPNPQRRIDEESDNERLLFQVQGHQGGPKSYKFGFDTGKKDDRQFRVEEQDNDGTVRGQYGYVDKRGRAHVMNYTSSAEKGFQVVRVS